MIKVLAGAVLATAIASAASAQVRDQRPPVLDKPAGKGVISGVVVTADSGRPVPRARVAIAGGMPRVNASVQTDDQGAFTFANLPAGQFTLTASKGGFLDTIYGQKQPGSGRAGTPIQLQAGQALTQISMPLARGGVITGLVVEESGEPAYGAAVRAYRWIVKDGARVLQQAGGTASSDDRGMYRIPGLLPGQYIVTASGRESFEIGVEGMAYFKVLETIGSAGDAQIALRADRLIIDKAEWAPDAANTPKTGFVTIYYPGTTQASSASTIAVAISEEKAGIDFRLQLMPIGRLSGVITGADGPVRGATVSLIDQGQIPGNGVRETRTSADGKYTFNGVAPGQYTVMARATPKGAGLEAGAREAVAFLASDELAQNAKRRAELAATIGRAAQLWGTSEIGFDGRDVADVNITLQPGLTVAGRVVFEGGTGPVPDPSRMSLTLTPVGQNRATGEAGMATPGPVDPDGQFTIRGVVPGRYTISVAAGAPGGYSLRSAVFGGVDVLDQPFELNGSHPINGGVVTLSARTTDVSGTVQDASGQPMPGVTVIVFASEEQFWTPNSRRIQAVRPATDGRYAFKNLPPGDYRVVAVVDADQGQWFDPDFLRSLGSFVSLTVADGGKHTLDLRAR